MKSTYLFYILLGVLVLYSCNDAPQQQQQQAMPYPVVTVPTKTVTAYKSYPASIEGTTNSGVRAKVSGYITEVLIDEGQKVTKGQPLFKLETQSLSQDAEAAQANVNAARVEVEKLVPLIEKDIISEVQLQTAKARLAQAESSYNSIVANIGYATIKSPVDGFVGSIPYRQGALVSPADPQPLTVVSQTEDVFVFFAMNEKQYLDFLNSAEGETRADKINNFPKVQLQLANGEIYNEEGVIETVTGQVNQTTGTVTFRAKFPNPSGILANGSSGSIRIPQTYDNVLVIPEVSTFERQGKIYTYKVQGDTVAINTPVQVIDRVDGLLVIQSGLKKNDKIVAKGVGKLRNNTPVVPQPVEFDSIAKELEPAFK